jgi:hypothetical protein
MTPKCRLKIKVFSWRVLTPIYSYSLPQHSSPSPDINKQPGIPKAVKDYTANDNYNMEKRGDTFFFFLENNSSKVKETYDTSLAWFTLFYNNNSFNYQTSGEFPHNIIIRYIYKRGSTTCKWMKSHIHYM